jgi:hypothetical protein
MQQTVQLGDFCEDFCEEVVGVVHTIPHGLVKCDNSESLRVDVLRTLAPSDYIVSPFNARVVVLVEWSPSSGVRVETRVDKESTNVEGWKP